MSYDIELLDPVTKCTIKLNKSMNFTGGTYCIGGSSYAELNITYNYAKHFTVIGPKGLREIYGKTGSQVIPMLEKAINSLNDDVDKDYWKATEGNAKEALKQVITLSKMHPKGIWSGD